MTDAFSIEPSIAARSPFLIRWMSQAVIPANRATPRYDTIRLSALLWKTRRLRNDETMIPIRAIMKNRAKTLRSRFVTKPKTAEAPNLAEALLNARVIVAVLKAATMIENTKPVSAAYAKKRPRARVAGGRLIPALSPITRTSWSMIAGSTSVRAAPARLASLATTQETTAVIARPANIQARDWVTRPVARRSARPSIWDNEEILRAELFSIE